ncbi:hypothetical protein RB195_015090 [Necator americanus]|uniref:Reverse transcriptase domain-containing protein n=1 Tax=Necator americanus TaxID=51031 RepID=A0ABR1E346_NECAM
MGSLATTIRFVTLNCRTLSSELQQTALSRLLRYLSVPDTDEKKVDGCAIAVRNDYSNLVEEFGSTSSRCAFVGLQDRRGRKLQIVIIVVIDANAKIGLEQQFDVLEKWYYPVERTLDEEESSSLSAYVKKVNSFDARKAVQADDEDSQTLARLRSGEEHPSVGYPKIQSFHNTASGKAVGEAAFPILRDHFKTLLNRHAASVLETEHVRTPIYAVSEEPPTESEVLICIQKMKNGKSGGEDKINAEMLKYLSPPGLREMAKIILQYGYTKGYLTRGGISLLRVTYKVLERIILDRLIKHREETTRDEQAGFCPGQSKIDQTFIVRRVTEIWQRYSTPTQSAFLDFEAAFDSPHQGRVLNARRQSIREFVRVLDDMNQRTTAAVRTPAGYTIPFEVVAGVRQGAVAGTFLTNFALDDIMREEVDQYPADIVLELSGCPLTDLKYADGVSRYGRMLFAESTTRPQHVVNLVSKLTATYRLRLRPDKCK